MSKHQFSESIEVLQADLERLKSDNVVDRDNQKQLAGLVHIAILDTCGKWMEDNQDVTLGSFSTGLTYGIAECIAAMAHSMEAGTGLIEQLVLFHQIILRAHARNDALAAAFPEQPDPHVNDFKLQ